MSDSGASRDDPPVYYERHVFCCTNVRPEGHPRGCCAAKDSERLRNYLKSQAKKMGLPKPGCALFPQPDSEKPAQPDFGKNLDDLGR